LIRFWKVRVRFNRTCCSPVTSGVAEACALNSCNDETEIQGRTQWGINLTNLYPQNFRVNVKHCSLLRGYAILHNDIFLGDVEAMTG